MVEVELFCKSFKYDFNNKCAHGIFAPNRMPDMNLKSVNDFIDDKLLGIGRDIIKARPEIETDRYALIETSLTATNIVNLNCDDQPCRTIDLKTMKPITPKRKSGYIGHATDGKLKIKIKCQKFMNCGACYAALESGKCSDKLVVETIGKTFFANKYGKQK